MKRLFRALAAFVCVLIADEYAVITVNDNKSSTMVDMTLLNFKYITDDLINDHIGQEVALQSYKEILKDAK